MNNNQFGFRKYRDFGRSDTSFHVAFIYNTNFGKKDQFSNKDLGLKSFIDNGFNYSDVKIRREWKDLCDDIETSLYKYSDEGDTDADFTISINLDGLNGYHERVNISRQISCALEALDKLNNSYILPFISSRDDSIPSGKNDWNNITQLDVKAGITKGGSFNKRAYECTSKFFEKILKESIDA